MVLRSTFEHVSALKGQMTPQGSTQSGLASISVPTSERFNQPLRLLARASSETLVTAASFCFPSFPLL
jgi:hypothetical protein